MHRCLLLLVFLALPACGDSFDQGQVDAGLLDLAAPDMSLSEVGAPDASPADLLAPDTVEPPPTITSVQDKGNDGSAVVGEEIWVQGTNFRAGCKVVFGTVQATVLSISQLDLRFQTPEAIATGNRNPVLQCPNGNVPFSLKVIRYHLVTIPDQDKVAVLREDAPGQILDSKKRLSINDADSVAVSHDSAVAYVGTARTATKSPRVSIVDLTTANGPTVLSTSVPYSEKVKMPVYGLAVSRNAPVLAVAGGLYVLFYDLTDPRKPQQKGKVQFVNVSGSTVPQITTGYFIDVDLSPNGKQASLLDGAADHLHVFDITTLSKPNVTFSKISVSAGTSSKPIVQIPIISTVLGLLKVKGGAAQDVTVSHDGKAALVLAGGGVNALVPETFNLDLNNTTISVVDLQTGAYLNKLEFIRDAHFPNNAVYGPSGTAYVTALSSSSAVLVKVIFQVAVTALIGGGSFDLGDIASLILRNFLDAIGVIRSVFDGTLFHLGGLSRVVTHKAQNGKFSRIPYIQAGMCTTHDGKQLLAAGQGWVVDIKLDFPKVSKFKFSYDLGVTVHDLSSTKSYQFISFGKGGAKILLPPWSFGHAACQQ